MAPLRAWHLLSLDAPTVAVLWCLSFAYASGVSFVHPVGVPLFLGCATWIAYVGDRVLDARLEHDAALLRERHVFYGDLWKRRRALLLALVASASATCAVLTLRALPRSLFVGYVALTLIALAYFAIVHARGSRLERALPKEAVVGLVFAIATALPTWLLLPARRHVTLLIAAALFAAIAWLNCVCIEKWEAAPTLSDDAHVSTRWAANHLGALLGVLASLAVLATTFCDPSMRTLAPLLIASSLLLGLLDRLRHRLSPGTLRILADVALLTPAPLLLARAFV